MFSADAGGFAGFGFAVGYGGFVEAQAVQGDGDGGPNHWECWMRDLDGYTIVVASPYGTADGSWQPGPDLFR